MTAGLLPATVPGAPPARAGEAARPAVAMLIRNPCTNDPRVLKEARTLAESGYDVTVVAVHRPPTLPALEERDGFRIVRVPADPVDSKALRVHRRIRNRVRDLSKPFIVHVKRPLRNWLAVKQRIHPADRAFRQAVARAGPVLLLPATVVVTGVKLLDPATFWLVEWASRPLRRPSLGLQYWRGSARALADRDVSAWHAHTLHTLLTGWLCARRDRAALVYDAHELTLEAGAAATAGHVRRLVMHAYEGFLARRADVVVTVNEPIAAHLERDYRIRRPLVVMNCPPVPPGLSREQERVLHERLGLDPGTRVVLYQGLMTHGRALPELVRASTLLDRAVVVFIGWGVARPELERLAADLDLGERVRFLEPVPLEELPPITRSADVGVVPLGLTSRNHYLATPNKIFEYLMAGVPVAVSNFPELARIAGDGPVGTTFDPARPDDIARAIRELLDDPRRDEMRKRAWDLARERYSWEIESRGLVHGYERLLEERAKVGR